MVEPIPANRKRLVMNSMIFLLMNRIRGPLLSLRHIPLVLKQRFKVNNDISDKIYQFNLKAQPPQLLRIDKVKKNSKNV